MFKQKPEFLSYSDVTDFIGIIVKIQYESSIKHELNQLIDKYGAKLLNYEPAMNELMKLCKTATQNTIESLSKKYIKNHILYYFSNDGFVSFIYSIVRSEANSYINSKLQDLNSKRTGLV